jgi:hypothetical protein
MPIFVRRSLGLAVVAILFLTGVASAARPGQYEGATGQRGGDSPLRISLAVSGGAVGDVQVGVLTKPGGGPCTPSTSARVFAFTSGRLTIDRHQRFAGKLTDGNGASVQISGRFKAGRVSGSFTVDLLGTQTCNSRKITFTASPPGGQVRGAQYAGTIGPGFPISFHVSADGRTVAGLVLNFDHTCGQAHRSSTYRFGGLTIRGSSFSGASIDHFGPKASDSLRVSGTFFGRVAVGQVTGTRHLTRLRRCTLSDGFTATAR